MKIKSLLLCLAIISSFLLGGCNYVTAPFADNNPEQSEENVGYPYKLTYVSHNDGTCSVNITFNHLYKQEFSVIIPEKSPEGDTVTVIDGTNFDNKYVPIIASKEVFDAMLDDIREDIPETSFEYKKFLAFFSLFSWDMYFNDALIAAREKYPIFNIMEFYILDDSITYLDLARIQSCIETYAPNFSGDFWVEHTADLNEQIRNSEYEIPEITLNFSDYVKEIILPSTTLEVKGFEFSNVSKMVFPKSVQRIDVNGFFGCENIEVTFEDTTGWYFENFDPELPSFVNTEGLKFGEDGLVLGLDDPKTVLIALNFPIYKK